MNIEQSLGLIYEKKNHANFFIFPFFHVLMMNFDGDKYMCMSSALEKEFLSDNYSESYMKGCYIIDKYEKLYSDSFGEHGKQYNSSHAISQKITGDQSWIIDYIDYVSFNKGKEKSNKPGARKVLYRIKKSKIEEVRKVIDSFNNNRKTDIVDLINNHKPRESSNTLQDSSTEKLSLNNPLNQIIYGPPGTGKTYETAKLAVEICDGHADQDRDALMQRYTELTEKNQIGFVTFHQSYSYEDFVEGIRPVVGNTDESQNSLAYTIEDGIFKQMCAYANKVPLSKQQSELKLDSLEGRSFYKISVGGLYDPHVEDYCFEHGYISLGYGGDIDYSVLPQDKKWETVRDSIEKLMDDSGYKRKSRFPIQAMAWFKNYIKLGDIVIVSKGMSKVQAIGVVTGEYEYKPDEISGYCHFRKVDWILQGVEIPVEKIQNRKFSQQTIYTLGDNALKKEYLESILCNKEIGGEAENHVLIIDEINRANISKVFGELITLLEKDKRAGETNTNALSVKLPYSRESFSIPDNLFVIGTMNTADRSIALLDTALRRRFEFKELMPDCNLPELDQEIDGVNLGKLLKTINDRIEYYFDREHTIGHAYLLGIEDFSQLKRTLLNKIIPLLQEYFYEDCEKVSLVLGETNNSQIIQTEKLSSPDDNDEEKIRYKINQQMTVENIKRIYSCKGKNSETVESSDNL